MSSSRAEPPRLVDELASARRSAGRPPAGRSRRPWSPRSSAAIRLTSSRPSTPAAWWMLYVATASLRALGRRRGRGQRDGGHRHREQRTFDHVQASRWDVAAPAAALAARLGGDPADAFERPVNRRDPPIRAAAGGRRFSRHEIADARPGGARLCACAAGRRLTPPTTLGNHPDGMLEGTSTACAGGCTIVQDWEANEQQRVPGWLGGAWRRRAAGASAATAGRRGCSA